MASCINTDFPVNGLLPKKETGACNYCAKYPDYDGKDVVIAILDTGVDPGASGLQKTPSGETKIIDLYDATGAGDVDTSTVVEAKDGEIRGLTGRKLKIPGHWVNPSGQFHVGVIMAYSIFPKALLPRLTKERKEKGWTRPHNQLLADSMKEKAEADQQPKPTGETEKLKKAELDARLELLKGLDDKYKDCGPTYDCVVFYDGHTWRACVDTSEVGDLAYCQLMASYREEHQYGTFSSLDMLNFSFNIYDSGNILEICTSASSHGTHVACISAAYEPDCPERSGVAPGAKIIAIKIGDRRIKDGSEETASSIVRAILRVIEWRCDLINLSFGESTRWNDDGRVRELIDLAVNKYGVLFFSSAGNSGPALTTVGAPGTTVSSAIGVGAYVSPDMMSAAYSMRDKVVGGTFTWSSRGPTIDGALGVTISAPGGAITSIPEWNLCGQKLMNGTSMSSPNATGCMALVLSGLKSRGVPYSTVSTTRAMINTAKSVETADTFSLGYGLFQVDKMFEYMLEHNNQPEDWVRFCVSTGRGRGIYLREPSHFIDKEPVHYVTITPEFVTNNIEDEVTNAEQRKAMIGFKKTLALTCDAPWVNLPTYLEMTNSSRLLNVKLDVGCLQPGAHFTEILGYDLECIEKGPLVRIPITVAKPESEEGCVDHEYSWQKTFTPGQICRHFVKVPAGATSATVKIETTKSAEPSTVLCMHAITLSPGCLFQQFEHEHFDQFRTGVQQTSSFHVKENATLELCMAKYWSNLGQADVEYSIQFYGMTTSQSPIVMHPGDSVTQIDVTSGLRRQAIAPSITLSNLTQTIRPSKATIIPLTTTRDRIPDGTLVFACVIEYTFKMTKSGEVTPDFSLLSNLLYESPFGSQFWMLYDENKQCLLSGDAYPLRFKYCSKLSAGEFTIRLQLRHTDTKLLERVKRAPMLLRHSLSSSTASPGVYASQKEAIIGGRLAGSITVPHKAIQPLFFTSIPDEKLKQLPVNLTAGMYLEGSLSLIKDRRTANVPFQYVLTESCNLASNDPKEKPVEKDKQTEYKEAKLKLDAQWIPKLEIDDGLTLYKQLFTECGYSQLTAHLAMLTALQKLISTSITDKKAEAKAEEGEDGPPLAGGKQLEYVQEFFRISSSIIDNDENVNKPEIIAFFGTKNDDSENPTTRKSELTKKRKDLIDVFAIHISVMSDLILADSGLDLGGIVSVDLLQKGWRQMLFFADATDKAVTKAYIKYARANECPCLAALQIAKSLDSGKDKEMEEQLIQIAEEMRWAHVQRHLTDWLCIKYPTAYALF